MVLFPAQWTALMGTTTTYYNWATVIPSEHTISTMAVP
jgi:hypothetical protein